MSWGRKGGKPQLTPAGCKFVHNDEIWKYHVSKEFKAHKRWPSKWGFLTDYYKDLHCNPSLPLNQTTAGTGAGTHSSEERGKTDFKEADFKADLKYPHTTAALIGWRSKDTAQLERYGSLGQARRRRSLREVLNWPKNEY